MQIQLDDEQKRLILAFVAGSACTTGITLVLVLPMERRFVKRIKTVLNSQLDVIKWVANHSLDLDREEFTKKFMEQVAFYNIVVEETS